MVNRMVNTHSAARSGPPQTARTPATLSRQTARTLKTMATSNATSNALPPGVSASKMIS